MSRHLEKLCAAFAACLPLILGAAQNAPPPPAAAKPPPPAGADCIGFDPDALALNNKGGSWKVVEGTTTLLDYGRDAAYAQRAVDVIQHYHFTRQCFVRRPNAAMMYWRNGVAVPPGNMAGQDCIALNPATVQALFLAGRWKVIDGKTWLLDYGSDRAAADEAVTVIRTYDLNRECFVARPHVAMQYWLAE